MENENQDLSQPQEQPLEVAVGVKEEKTKKMHIIPREKRKKKRILITVVIVVVLLLLLRLLGGSSGTNLGAKVYTAERAAYRDVTVSVSGTGTIKPIHSGTIVGMVTGDILSDSFEIGDKVEKGQVLYVIDAKKAETGVEQAQLGVEQAQLSYDQASRAMGELTVTSTVSGRISSVAVKIGDSIAPGTPVAKVTDNQNMTLKCGFNAVDAKYISAGQSAVVTITATGETVAAVVKNVSGYTTVGSGGTLVQAVELTVKNPGGITGGMAATAQVGNYACQSGGTFEYATETEILAKSAGTVKEIYVSEGSAVSSGTKLLCVESENTEDQLKGAALAVENAELSLRTAQDMLEEYQIKAPITGTVTQKDLNAGDNIGQAGTTVMAVISDLSALTFDMMIDELDIPKVKIGQSVKISVDALPGRTFTGYVDKININGTTANGVTNYPVTVVVENPDAALLPGMNVSSEIQIDQNKHVLTIPLSAVSRGNIVQVLPENAVSEKDGIIDYTKAKDVEVTLGANDSRYVEIRSGISEGDFVLVKGILGESQVSMGTEEEMTAAAAGE